MDARLDAAQAREAAGPPDRRTADRAADHAADLRRADATSRCPDGTPWDQCAATKPGYCQGGTLVPRCAGPDGVRGNADDCGCPAGAICRPDGSCCTPSCAGKSCGGDGCGGSCGGCDGFPCAGHSPICAQGSCSACQCPNNCYNITGYCGAQGGTLKDCHLAAPRAGNSNYCFCTVHCASGSPADLEIGDSRDPASGGC